MYKVFLVLFVSLLGSVTYSQSLSGVVENESGEGIVNVVIEEVENVFSYSKTAKKGRFTSSINENTLVRISANGYESRLVNLEATTYILVDKPHDYIYYNDVNFVRAGLYTKDECKDDFNTVWANGFKEEGNPKENTDRVYIDPEEDVTKNGKSLRILYPEGEVDTKKSGAQWRIDLGGEYEDLYLSYQVKFSPNFDFTLGGKLPGFDGSEGGYSSDKNEWSGKLMWRDNGKLEFYLHPPGTRNKVRYWWNYQGETARIKRGEWQTIQIHYKLNEAGKKNGLMEAWLNDVLVARIENTNVFRTSTEGNIYINNLFFSTFFGGDETYAPTKDEYAWFDNFIVSKSKIQLEPELITDTKDIAQFMLSHIYPNPSEDGIFYRNSTSDFKVYSVVGSLVLSGNKEVVDLSVQPKGIYFLKDDLQIIRLVKN